MLGVEGFPEGCTWLPVQPASSSKYEGLLSLWPWQVEVARSGGNV